MVLRGHRELHKAHKDNMFAVVRRLISGTTRVLASGRGCPKSLFVTRCLYQNPFRKKSRGGMSGKRQTTIHIVPFLEEQLLYMYIYNRTCFSCRIPEECR